MKSKTKTTKLKAVKSLGELRQLADTNEAYKRLMQAASDNLGGCGTGNEFCYRWLLANAQEIGEEGVVEEVNFCRDLI
jgi:hypothetical protein